MNKEYQALFECLVKYGEYLKEVKEKARKEADPDKCMESVMSQMLAYAVKHPVIGTNIVKYCLLPIKAKNLDMSKC